MLENDEALAQALSAYYPLEAKLRLRLRELCREQSYPRQFHLLRPGQVSAHAWFLLEGSARTYSLHAERGDEVTVWFWQKGDVVWGLGSFCRGLPCRHYLQMLEDTRLLALHRRQLEELATAFPSYRNLERAVTEACHTRILRHYRERLRLPAQERFSQLMEQHPGLFHQAPVKDIASFLGVHPDTLSRLRAGK